jgi:glucokinase
MRCAIGIDLGGTDIKAVAMDGSGAILDRAVRVTNDLSFSIKEWSATVSDLIRQFEAGLGAEGKPAVGMASPGIAAMDERCSAYLPGKLKGLEGFDWTAFLQRPMRAPVLNDGHAALLGEAWIGAAAGLRDVVLLTLGTGVGGAILSDGRLIKGAMGRAGHVGHISIRESVERSITGTPGALELAIGNYTLAERSGGRFSSTRQLVEAHVAGDAGASRIWLESVGHLARGITSLINVLDPEAIIIGGGIAEAGDALFQPLAAALEEIEWRPGGHRVRVLPAVLGKWAGAIGAARHAMQ